MIELRSQRLIGRPFSSQDYTNLRLIHGDPFVMHTLSIDGKPLPDSVTHAWVQHFQEHWHREGFGAWSFSLAQDGDFVGYCGLKHCLVEGAPEIELLYGQRSVYWRKGFASEMASACLIDGRTHLRDRHHQRGHHRGVVAFTLPHNYASRGVMIRNGFHYERDMRHKGLAHVLYRRSL